MTTMDSFEQRLQRLDARFAHMEQMLIEMIRRKHPNYVCPLPPLPHIVQVLPTHCPAPRQSSTKHLNPAPMSTHFSPTSPPLHRNTPAAPLTRAPVPHQLNPIQHSHTAQKPHKAHTNINLAHTRKHPTSPPLYPISPPTPPLPFNHPSSKVTPPPHLNPAPLTSTAPLPVLSCKPKPPAAPLTHGSQQPLQTRAVIPTIADNLNPAPLPISIPLYDNDHSVESPKAIPHTSKAVSKDNEDVHIAAAHMDEHETPRLNDGATLSETQAIMEQVSAEKFAKVAIEEPCPQISASLTLHVTPAIPETIPPKPPPYPITRDEFS